MAKYEIAVMASVFTEVEVDTEAEAIRQAQVAVSNGLLNNKITYQVRSLKEN